MINILYSTYNNVLIFVAATTVGASINVAFGSSSLHRVCPSEGIPSMIFKHLDSYNTHSDPLHVNLPECKKNICIFQYQARLLICDTV